MRQGDCKLQYSLFQFSIDCITRLSITIWKITIFQLYSPSWIHRRKCISQLRFLSQTCNLVIIAKDCICIFTKRFFKKKISAFSKTMSLNEHGLCLIQGGTGQHFKPRLYQGARSRSLSLALYITGQVLYGEKMASKYPECHSHNTNEESVRYFLGLWVAEQEDPFRRAIVPRYGPSRRTFDCQREAFSMVPRDAPVRLMISCMEVWVSPLGVRPNFEGSRWPGLYYPEFFPLYGG